MYKYAIKSYIFLSCFLRGRGSEFWGCLQGIGGACCGSVFKQEGSFQINRTFVILSGGSIYLFFRDKDFSLRFTPFEMTNPRETGLHSKKGTN